MTAAKPDAVRHYLLFSNVAPRVANVTLNARAATMPVRKRSAVSLTDVAFSAIDDDAGDNSERYYYDDGMARVTILIWRMPRPPFGYRRATSILL